jgi:putative membrane protein
VSDSRRRKASQDRFVAVAARKSLWARILYRGMAVARLHTVSALCMLTQGLNVARFYARSTVPPGINPDRSRRLADTGTELALERTLMASERTLMAWVRTSLALISFGFTLGKLGDALQSANVTLWRDRTTDIIGVAYYLVVIGTVALVLAAVQNRIEVSALSRQGLARRPSLAFVIAILMSLLGLFVFTDLVTQLRQTTS